MNQMEQGSSSESDNIFSRFKKVDYEGVISEEESSEQDDESELVNHKQKRKSYTKKIQSLQKGKDSQQEQDGDPDLRKTKNIKKNCVSAKRSRQRKRLYIELLQDKAQSFKNEILRHRDRIAQQKKQILKITKDTNTEKYAYINQKIKDSQAIVEFLNNDESKNAQIIENLKKKQSKPKQNGRASRQTFLKQQDRSIKSAKSLKNQFKKEQSQPTSSHQQRINLNRIVDSFLYKFGFNGVLKKDVIQFQKQRWYQLAIEQKNLQSKAKTSQLEKNLNEFNSCMNSLDESSHRMQYLVRKLREKVSDKYVAEILLDKLFLQKSGDMQQIKNEKSD